MAKTRTPFHSATATGIFAKTIAAVRHRNAVTIIRKAPTAVLRKTIAQIDVRNKHAYTLAALRFATANAQPPCPYTDSNQPIWRTLETSRRLWNNVAQAAFAALQFGTSLTAAPAWADLDAATQAAWNAAALNNLPPMPPIVQQHAAPQQPTLSPAGAALYIHELAFPVTPGRNPPHQDYPPIYNPTTGPYTRALWDYNLQPWDGDAYLWDATTIATWDTPANIEWDANFSIWDAR